MKDNKENIANFFWHGDALSLYEQACISSFIQNRFEVRVWTYDKIELPVGAVPADARRVLPETDLGKYTQSGMKANLAAFSDAFRYALLRQYGGWWFDTDVFCLRPCEFFLALIRETNAPIICGLENPVGEVKRINGAVLYVNNEALLEDLCNGVESAGTDIKWGALGPALLTDVLQARGIFSVALTQNYFYPVHCNHADWAIRPTYTPKVERLTCDSLVYHYWNEILRRHCVPKNILPPQYSFLYNKFLEVMPNYSDKACLDESTVAALFPVRARITKPARSTNRISPRAMQWLMKGSLRSFVPASAGSLQALFHETLKSVAQSVPLLNQLVHVLGCRKPNCITVEDFAHSLATQTVASQQLATLFAQYGSDKSTVHNYHFIYGPILASSSSFQSILEIGLGTNDTRMVSHMGKNGSPGASLRAFRDFLPEAKVYGADIDENILFCEERIDTFHVDQTDFKSFEEFGKKIPKTLDLIIDDGLHSPNANISTLLFGIERVSQGGWIIIEDIPAVALPFWGVIAALLPDERFKCYLIKAKECYVFAIQRRI